MADKCFCFLRLWFLRVNKVRAGVTGEVVNCYGEIQNEWSETRLETLLLAGLASGDPMGLDEAYRESLRWELAARRMEKNS